jgi:hypothetical protein
MPSNERAWQRPVISGSVLNILFVLAFTANEPTNSLIETAFFNDTQQVFVCSNLVPAYRLRMSLCPHVGIDVQSWDRHGHRGPLHPQGNGAVRSQLNMPPPDQKLGSGSIPQPRNSSWRPYCAAESLVACNIRKSQSRLLPHRPSNLILLLLMFDTPVRRFFPRQLRLVLTQLAPHENDAASSNGTTIQCPRTAFDVRGRISPYLLGAS